MNAEGFHDQVHLANAIMARPYLCPAMFWTIGFGHLCTKDALPISREQALIYMKQDIMISRIAVAKLITVQLNDWQRTALIDFTFNLGAGRLRASTMRAMINRGELNNVPGELAKWCYGGGRKLPGLILRRRAEIAMWQRQ